MKDNESRLLYGQYLKILEEQTAAQGNGYQLLASQGIYPNKKYNFYNIVKKWYEDNTNIPPDQIEATLKAKEQAALKDKNPNYMRLAKFKTNSLLMGPEQWNPPTDKTMGYMDQNNNLYINPNMKWNNYDDLITTLIHETLHGIQKKKMAWDATKDDLYNQGARVDIQGGDPNIRNNALQYISQTMEIDPVLAQVNRIVAKVKNKMILPNSTDAERELRWVLDPKNDQQIPNEFRGDVHALQDIVSGTFKNKRNSPQEQDRIIKSWAQRLSLLAKDTRQNTNLNIA